MPWRWALLGALLSGAAGPAPVDVQLPRRGYGQKPRPHLPSSLLLSILQQHGHAVLAPVLPLGPVLQAHLVGEEAAGPHLGGTPGHGDGLPTHHIWRGASTMLPIRRSMLPSGGESDVRQPQGTVPRRGGDRTGTAGYPHCRELWDRGDPRGGSLFTPSAWVCCGAAQSDSGLSQVTGGTASPGSAGAGWSSPSSRPCSRRSAEEEVQPAGPSPGVPAAGCRRAPGTPGKHPAGEQSLTPTWEGVRWGQGTHTPLGWSQPQTTRPCAPPHLHPRPLGQGEKGSPPPSPGPAPRGRMRPARPPDLPRRR